MSTSCRTRPNQQVGDGDERTRCSYCSVTRTIVKCFVGAEDMVFCLVVISKIKIWLQKCIYLFYCFCLCKSLFGNRLFLRLCLWTVLQNILLKILSRKSTLLVGLEPHGKEMKTDIFITNILGPPAFSHMLVSELSLC